MDFRNTEETNTSPFLHEYPLTRGQAALWFHHQLAPENAAYNLAGAVAIPGDTDLEALRRALRRLAERHALLRTVFAAQHGIPIQRVQPSSEVTFQCEEASGRSMAQLDDQLAKAIHRPFDLERGPAWRVAVFQRAPLSTDHDESSRSQDHLVLLVLHHIIGDLWSIAIILSEVAALYREETTAAPAALKPLRASYADHVHQELERLAEPQAEMSWDYWRTVLAGERSSLSLPTDRPRPPISTGRGAVQPVLLDKKLTDGLRTLAEKQQVALYTVLLTAFQTLLHRYTGQNDILVGFPKAGRSPATARVVGYFVNQTIVRADFTENPRFIDLLHRVQNSIVASAGHDWYPFSLLVQRLQPTRDLSRSPLIQAVFSWQQAPRLIPRENAGAFVLGQANHAIDLDGLCVRSIALPQRAAPFDLMMLAAEAPGGLTVTIEYATDLFDTATIARMTGCYRTLLESIAAAPEQPVSDLAILPEPEREQLVEGWNATMADYPAQACLHQLFERQVERTPEIVAVAGGNEQLTYRQLNQHANQLAHFLQEQGAGPEILVGVCLEPSVQMVIALLGILKAGGAYLPLDPTYPEERLSSVLADASPALLLTRQALRPRLPEFTGTLVDLDAEKDRLRIQSQTNPACSTTPDHLAYVMYTSGSTGTPKGVALAHRGVVSLLTDFQQRQAIQPGERCSWWTSPSFDVSVYEIFSPLLAGGCLEVIPENLRLDAPRLLDWLQVHHIGSAYLPPFLLTDFAAWVYRHPGASPLRRLLVGVEPIPDDLLARICAQLPALCILNGYGPTETTICSTLYVVDPAYSHPGNTPIGKPVANTQIYVLDSALQLAPVGVVGELYIGGVGLARGYLNQPELTAQCFIESPFRPGERLYRSGDLARCLPDGNLMFVGRSDTQVKLHGVRIELGEIEATLTRHQLVKQAAVLLQEQASGGKHLVAYVVPTEGSAPAPDDLRHFLNQQLPHAMTPTAFVVLDAFPLTATGKVDRKAFPAPHNLQPKQGNVYRAPQTNAEQILVAIWQQVLGLEAIGVDDNFFELGGDSILSIQIVAGAVEAGLHLSPQHIFQAPTIAGLAALADAAVPATHTPSDFSDAGLSQAELDAILRITSRPTVAIPNRNLEAVYPLSPMQQGMVFHTLYTPESGVYFEQTTFTIQGQFNVPALEKAWQRAFDRHTILRTSFVWQGLDRMLQVVHPDVKAPLELQDWRDISASEQQDRFDRLLTTERRRGFDLSVPPLLRLAILQTANDTYRVLLNHHHALLDGWSIPLLFKEVFAFYDAFTRNQDLTLPRARPYRDYIAWLQAQDLAAAQAFWHKELDGFVPDAWPSLQHSPAPFAGASRPAEQDGRLPTQATAALQALARRQHLTLGTLLQGAWAILLSRYVQRDEVLFGVTVAGRPSELPDAMAMTGLFINTLPLRVQIAPESRLIEWLQKIQAKVIEIQQYGYSPLTQIQAWSGVPRGAPLFDTILVLENYPNHTALSEQFGRLRISNARSIGQTAYPLTVAVTPGEQLELRILYDPARLEPAIVHRVLNQLCQVLENMVADSTQRVSTRSLSQTPLIPLFQQHVERTSEKITVARRDEFVPPGNPLEQYLVQRWKKLLKTDQVGIHDNFFELGGNSLTGAICIYQLQGALDETIPIAAIFEAPTIFELAGYLEEKHVAGVARLLGASVPASAVVEEAIRPMALVPIQPKGSKPPLFCIHPAGGIVFPYYTLAPYLGKDQPLYGIQDPSLHNTQSASKSIEALAAHYLEALKTVQPEGPYHLLGWSVGGVVAYEMAQQLSRQGQSVALLIMLDTSAPASVKALQPQTSLRDRPTQMASWAKELPDRIQRVGSALKPIAGYIRSGLFLLAASVKRRGGPAGEKPTIIDLLGWAGLDTWRTRLLREADVAATTSQETSLLLVEMPAVRRILELIREHRQLVRRYAAETYPGRITLFRAARSGLNGKGVQNPTMGWGILAEGGVDVHCIQANHVALLVKPHVETLARELRICLDQSR
jgi:amino acid adenylation domain-containing protein